MLENITSPDGLKRLNLKQKQQLAGEIREKIIQVVSENGGHLASNLGAVEMTIALHSVLDTPNDKLIFDVGHQCYAHKLLTGRYERFDTLRQAEGLSGFTRRDESVYDLNASGHASDSISLALGFARARDIKKQHFNVAVVIGDGALTGGMCYEALNDAGQTKTPMLIVLNDNEMSISRNVGSMSKHLTHMRQSNIYRGFKQFLRKSVNRLPRGGKRMERFLSRIKDSIKTLLVTDQFFDSLDIEYLGPIDGHDISEMEKVFKTALTYDKPVVVHIVTCKGKGYEPAEKNPDAYHSVSPKNSVAKRDRASAGKAVGKWLCEQAESDEKIVAVSAAMLKGTGLEEFEKRFPDRCFDVGIAEEHACAFASGMALEGLKPYLALYSTFAQRAFDQIMIDACLNRAPLKLLIDRSGLNGQDGETHQGVFDSAFLRMIPNLTVCAASSIAELKQMLDFSADFDSPIAIKYPKELPEGDICDKIQLGKWQHVRQGKRICLISYGLMLDAAKTAADILSQNGLDVSVINARFLKPIDTEMLGEIASSHEIIFTLEDSALAGGFGQEIKALVGNECKCHCLGVEDKFIPAGLVEWQLEYLKLDAKSVSRKILAILNRYKSEENTCV